MPEEASPPPARNVIERMVNRACNALEGPVVWFRGIVMIFFAYFELLFETFH